MPNNNADRRLAAMVRAAMLGPQSAAANSSPPELLQGYGVAGSNQKSSVRDEVRSLQFWRAIIAECLSAFFYAFLLCGACVPWPPTTPQTQNAQTPAATATATNAAVALTSGFAMCTLVQCFGHISGAHVNPALTFAFAVTRLISPLRALLYVTAQCGGAIAGAALLYGVTVPGSHGNLGTTMVHPALSPWQAFGIEFILSFIVVFTAMSAVDPHRRSVAGPALTIGAAYLVCSLAGLPSTGAAINPTRSLGPAFVMNKWSHHWVYWFGPMGGGILAGMIYEYIFDQKKSSKGLREVLEELDRAESSANSQDEDYEDPDAKVPKYGTTTAAGASGNNMVAQSNGPFLHSTTPNHTFQRHQHYDTYRAALPLPPLPQSNGNYGPLPGMQVTPSGASLCDSVHYRPPSSSSVATGNYATIHGNRPGAAVTMARVPQRMDYGPGATKF